MIYFTADLHFGCTNLIRDTRPEFASTEQHDAAVLDNINQLVGRGDDMYILGDFCQHKSMVAKYRQLIKCKHIFFILGNHDHWKTCCDVFGRQRVWTQKMVRLGGGLRALCSHHPQAFWDRSHCGVYHLYGHLHNNAEREAMMDLGLPGRRSMDAGIDSARKHLGCHRPFHANEILEILSERPGHDIIERHK